jgi:hypothetical protein
MSILRIPLSHRAVVCRTVEVLACSIERIDSVAVTNHRVAELFSAHVPTCDQTVFVAYIDVTLHELERCRKLLSFLLWKAC